VHEELWLLAVSGITDVVLVHWRPDHEERVDDRHLARRAAGHPRPEGEAADEEFPAGMMLHAPVDRRGDVLLLPLALVVRSAAGAGAAEVEAQRGHVRVLQTAGDAEHHFVVQRAAAEGVGVADHGDAGGILQLAIERLEASRAAVQIDVAQRLRIHSTLTITRSPSTRT